MLLVFKSQRPVLPKPSACEAQPRAAGSLGAAFRSFCAVLLLLLVLPAAASAYTLVMRNGRRVEIPDSFIVTRTTLSYEAAPGINVTLQLSTIDIAATERLNGEPEGALLRRIPELTASPASARARRTITNRELEGARLARERSEAAYERRRLELGLPSVEETRRSSEEQAARLRELSRQSEEERAQAEGYWRARASELRTEFAVVDAELNYLRSQLGPSRPSLLAGSFTVVTGVVPFFPFRPRLPAYRPSRPLSGFVSGSAVPAQSSGAVTFGGGSTRGRVLLNPRPPIFHRPPFLSGPRLFVPPLGLLPSVNTFYDTTYDRTLMIARLRELEAARAGLEARWRLLEDEARRAGASPGWLRP
ncbi:MAG TPA: hypothetical protein VF544_03650 [Pyrinomonadaceae bacterium]